MKRETKIRLSLNFKGDFVRVLITFTGFWGLYKLQLK